jgi:hypothetical protein
MFRSGNRTKSCGRLAPRAVAPPRVVDLIDECEEFVGTSLDGSKPIQLKPPLGLICTRVLSPCQMSMDGPG